MIRQTLMAAALLAATPALAQDEPAGTRVEINGMEVYYEVSGEGPPLVVLHGAYMNIPSMGKIVPMLAATHEVYILELQGHGRTTDIDRPITYPNLADDVAAFMDAVGLEQADVFGYSMGAAAGLQLAIRHPEKVEKQVAASVAYDAEGWQPAFTAFIPQMTPEFFVGTPMEDAYRELAADPEGFPALVEKLIALEHEPMAWEAEVAALETPAQTLWRRRRTASSLVGFANFPGNRSLPIDEPGDCDDLRHGPAAGHRDDRADALRRRRHRRRTRVRPLRDHSWADDRLLGHERVHRHGAHPGDPAPAG